MIETVDAVEYSNNFRIVHKFKPGILDYYTVEQRVLFGMGWVTLQGEAQQYLTSESMALDWLKNNRTITKMIRVIEKRYGEG